MGAGLHGPGAGSLGTAFSGVATLITGHLVMLGSVGGHPLATCLQDAVVHGITWPGLPSAADDLERTC